MTQTVTGHATAPVVTQPPGGANGRTGPPCRVPTTVVRVATARSSYTIGQPVALRVSARNRSRQTCSLPTGSCLPQVIVTASDGAVVWNRASTGTSCMFGQSISLGPGHVARATVRWTGRPCAGRTPTDCPNTSVPAGVYQVEVRWLGAGTSTLLIVP